jgi:hypothetical protein
MQNSPNQDLFLRDVVEDDLSLFFDFQLDPTPTTWLLSRRRIQPTAKPSPHIGEDPGLADVHQQNHRL